MEITEVTTPPPIVRDVCRRPVTAAAHSRLAKAVTGRQQRHTSVGGGGSVLKFYFSFYVGGKCGKLSKNM